MIQSFHGNDTRELFVTEHSRRFRTISRVAMRKLIQLNRAAHLNDLRVPPGNRLKAGKGPLSGWHSIRVNDQWRIYFKWTKHGPEQVHIDDKH